MTEDIKTSVKDRLESLKDKLKKNKYLFIMLLAGAILLMWPSGETEKTEVAVKEKEESISFDLDEQENKLEMILAEIHGAGKVEVMLTLKSTSERVIASDKEREDMLDGAKTETASSEKAVIISGSSSKDDAVTLKYVYPEYLGAIVVAEGADKAAVKLALTEATAAATGLSSNNIQVIKMK